MGGVVGNTTPYNTRAYTCAWVCVRKDARLQDSTSPVRKIFFPSWEKMIGQLGKMGMVLQHTEHEFKTTKLYQQSEH